MIPDTDNSLALRTDYSDEAAWKALCTAIQEPDPVHGFSAHFHFVSSPEYDRLTGDKLVAALSEGSRRWYAFVIDSVTLSHPDRPVLVIDLNQHGEPGRTFRVIPSEIWAVENNLWLANMDFCEFADSVGRDGIFRGFPKT